MENGKKFAQFRIAKLTSSGANNQISHDMRLNSPKYVNKELSVLNKMIKGLKLDKGFVKSHIEQQKTLIKEKTGRSAQESAEFFSSAIMTFSEEMAEDYKNNPQLFEELSLKFIDEIEKRFGFQVIYAKLHLDEKTPHIHLMLDNISKKDGKGVRRRTNPKILSDIQTLIGECFEPMGYERGESSFTTNRRHLNVKQMHEITEAFNSVKDSLEALQDEKEALADLIDRISRNDPKTAQILEFVKSKKKLEDLPEKAQTNIKEFIGNLGKKQP